MGCNCGGRRGAVANSIVSGNGVARVWRLTHPNGSTVNYWEEREAEAAHAVLLAKETRDAAHADRDPRPVLLEPVDARTGEVLVSG